MQRLLLLRHTRSDWPSGIPDHERPLSPRGVMAAQMMGAYMARHGLLPDLAIVSTARRTRQTWELVESALGRSIRLCEERRIYEAPVATMLDIIQHCGNEVATLVLVGHNPGLRELTLALTGDGRNSERLKEKFPTGGLAVIDFDLLGWEAVAKGSGKLERFVTPQSIDRHD